MEIEQFPPMVVGADCVVHVNCFDLDLSGGARFEITRDGDPVETLEGVVEGSTVTFAWSALAYAPGEYRARFFAGNIAPENGVARFEVVE